MKAMYATAKQRRSRAMPADDLRPDDEQALVSVSSVAAPAATGPAEMSVQAERVCTRRIEAAPACGLEERSATAVRFSLHVAFATCSAGSLRTGGRQEAGKDAHQQKRRTVSTSQNAESRQGCSSSEQHQEQSSAKASQKPT